jgi:hypothetical protein
MSDNFWRGFLVGSLASSSIMMWFLHHHQACFCSQCSCSCICPCITRFNRFKEGVGEVTDKTKDMVGEMVDTTKEGVGKAVDKTKEVVENVEDLVKEEKKGSIDSSSDDTY